MVQVPRWNLSIVVRVEEMKTGLIIWADELLKEEPGSCLSMCLNRKYHHVNHFACVTVALMHSSCSCFSSGRVSF